MKLEELPENSRKLLDLAANEFMCMAPLKVVDGEPMWATCVEETMDAIEELRKKGLRLETVHANEINMGFGFRATSADGTEWESRPLDCHEYAKGQKVGRFADSEGNLVIVRKR
jgi:hypothetical protein